MKVVLAKGQGGPVVQTGSFRLARILYRLGQARKCRAAWHAQA